MFPNNSPGAAPSPMPPATRLNVQSLDPRSLFPTPENIQLVSDLLSRVQLQLEYDREQVKLSPDPRSAKEYRNQTLNYLSLLNDWLNQANAVQARKTLQNRSPSSQASPHRVVMDPCQVGEFLVQTSSNAQQLCKCLVDRNNRYFVQVKRLRQTIYGSVRLYQIGRLESGVVRFPHPVEEVAVKVFSKELVSHRRSRDGHSVQEDPYKELAIQQRLSAVGHAFVMPLLGCLETPTEFFAVLPFVGGGELFEFVANRAPLPEKEARNLFRSMLDGVHYCHTAGICHRDISLENFLLGGPHASDPLLIDFGLSVIMEPSEDGQGWKPIPHAGPVGKSFYMAPEIRDVNSQPPAQMARGLDGTMVDVWSLGVCLAIMLTGVPLWECASTLDDRFQAAVIRRDLPRLVHMWGFPISREVGDLLQRMLEFEPRNRLTIPQISQHAWFKH